MVGIYKIKNLINNKIYIGQSKDILKRWDSYKKLRCKTQTKLYRSLKKYGIENHKFEIITECDIDQLNNLERYYQDLYDVCGENGLNLLLTKSDGRKCEHSEETKRKIGEKHKGRIPSDETRKKLSEAGMGRIFTKEVRDKIGKSNTGKVRSEETRKKISESRKGILHTEEAKRKISKNNAKTMLGKNHSEETKLKMSEIKKKLYENGEGPWNKGKKMSDEICKKNSEAQKKKYANGWMPSNSKKVINIETSEIYKSIKECERKTEYRKLQQKLSGARPNKTPIRYL
jgi:group I intron endonuclease